MTAIDNAIGTDDQIILPKRHSSVSDDGLDWAFQIALLLSGSVTQAETAIQDAIASIAPDDISDRTLLHAASNARSGPHRYNFADNNASILRHGICRTACTMHCGYRPLAAIVLCFESSLVCPARNAGTYSSRTRGA